MHRRLFPIGFFAVLLLLLGGGGPPLNAQTISGSIAGTVFDPTGAVVSGVAITVANPATGRTYYGSTNDQGYYRVQEIPPGLYEVSAERAGFQSKRHTGVRVSVNRVTEEDFVLEVPPTTEEVIVEATKAPLTDTTGPTLSTYFPDKQVTELPILTRDINNLALLAPGVSSVRTFSFASTLVPFSVNGSRGRDNNFIIDSVDNNEPLFGGAATQFTNTDVFAEYTILTHQMKAEFGRNSGATINVITKSGSNFHHGTLFWFTQHDRFNARNRVEEQALLGDPATFYENQGGFTWGGPMKKDKAFFFLSYQWDRARNQLSSVFPVLGTLPTSDGLTTLRGLTQTLALRALLASPTVQGIPSLSAGCFRRRAPTGFRTTNPCRATSTSVGTNAVQYNVFLIPDSNLFDLRDHQASARFDFPINPTNDLYGRYLFDDLRTPRGVLSPAGEAAFSDLGLLPEWRLLNRQRTQSLLVNWRHYWVSALNELRFSFSRVSQQIGTFDVDERVREQQAAAIVADSFGGFGTPPLPSFSASFPAAGFRFTLGRESRPAKTSSSTFQVQDNYSYTRGRHSLKFGANFVRIMSNIRNVPSDLGLYFFGDPLSAGGFDCFIREPTNQATQCTFGSNATTNALVVLQRFPNVLADSSGNIIGRGQDSLPLREFDQFYFFQDDFRAHAKFTLSFGLRYENFGQPINKIHELNPNGPRVDSDDSNFAPRLGFAWSPWKKTVIRGGYALFYNPMVLNIPLLVWQSGPVSPLFVGDALGGPMVTPGSSFWQPRGVFPGQPFTPGDLTNNVTGLNVRVFGCNTQVARATAGTVPLLNCSDQDTVDRALANPYVQSWSLTWQQELTPSLILEIGWVGSKGTKLFQRVDENPFCFFANSLIVGQTSDTGCTARATDVNLARRRNPARGGITRIGNGGRSTYHALQVNFTKRLGHTAAGDIAVSTAYTWSHMLDTASEIFGPGVRLLSCSDPRDCLRNPVLSLGAVEAITPLAQDPNNVAAEKGDSAFDRRHRLALSYLWELPSPQEGARKFFGGGWQLNGILTLQSGQAFSPLNGFGTCVDYNGDGRITNDRPALGNPRAPANRIALLAECSNPALGYVDLAGNTIDPATARFVQVPLGVRPGTPFRVGAATFLAGNAGRNSLTGPGIVNFDFAVFKNFRWAEGKKTLQFRWEIYDLFNTPNPGFPIGNVFATDAQPTPAFAFLPRATPASVTGVIPENALDARDPITNRRTFLSRASMNTTSRRMLFGVKFIF